MIWNVTVIYFVEVISQYESIRGSNICLKENVSCQTKRKGLVYFVKFILFKNIFNLFFSI